MEACIVSRVNIHQHAPHHRAPSPIPHLHTINPSYWSILKTLNWNGSIHSTHRTNMTNTHTHTVDRDQVLILMKMIQHRITTNSLGFFHLMLRHPKGVPLITISWGGGGVHRCVFVSCISPPLTDSSSAKPHCSITT